MTRSTILTGAFLMTASLAVTARANIYTVGHIEGTGGDARSWLETWPNDFGPRIDITDVGVNKDPFFGSPHEALGVGDLNDANPGDEFLLGRANGFASIIKQDGSTPRIGGALVFRTSPSTPGHIENQGFQFIATADYDAGSAGPEVITMANNGIMEIWAYDQGSGTIDTSAGTNGRVDIRIWTSISSQSSFDGSALGDFDPSNAGLEVALLRTDGLVEIWDAKQTGTWSATAGDRLAIFDILTPALHDPFDHFFAGDLDAARAGDELAPIGSDGWLEIFNPLTGTRLSAPSNAYSTSGHDPFLAVAADAFVLAVIPEPATLALLGLAGCLSLRRRIH